MFKTQLSPTAIEELKLAIDNLYSLVVSVNYTQDTYTILKSDIFNLSESKVMPNFKAFISEYLSRYSAEDFKNFPLIFDFDRLVEHLHNTNGVYSMEVKFNISSTISNWFELKYILVENADETDDINILILAQDISNRKMVEENLKDAFQATEIAAKAKTDFLSKMSQDLKTPINMILNMIHIANGDLSNTENVKDCLTKMEISSRYLFKIIDNAIDMVQIESGKFNIDHRSFNIVELIENTFKDFADDASVKNVSFDINIHNNGVDQVVSDAYRLKQILKHLLSNSFKYAPEDGNVSLELLLTKIVSNRAYFSIIVENNGPTFKEGEIERLFRPFEQGHVPEAVMNEPFNGIGLGLTLCKSIVEILGGTITASNKPDNDGVRFEVQICCMLDENCIPTDLEYIADEAYLRFPNKHVLIVDDDDELYNNVGNMLQSLGIKADRAINGLEAVNAFEASETNYYDLIFMRTHLPVMSGFDAASAIRNSFREDGASVPIIALVSSAKPSDSIKAAEIGMDAHLIKPIDLNDIFLMLKYYIQ